MVATGRLLILCEPYDHSALWAADRLRARGARVDLVTSTALAGAERWEHRIDAGGATIAIRLGDGRTITGAPDQAVLNRLTYLPGDWTRRIGGPDREYALQEMYALYLSWLHALPGIVINRPTPAGLCGTWRHESAWTMLAGQAGLPAASLRSDMVGSPTDAPELRAIEAIVVGDRMIAPGLPARLHEACIALARRAGVTLLGICFSREAVFVSASPLPNLIPGGEELIDALAAALDLERNLPDLRATA